MGGGICRLVSPVGLVPDVRHQGIGVHLGPGGVHCGALPVADLSSHHRQTGVRELIGAGGECGGGKTSRFCAECGWSGHVTRWRELRGGRGSGRERRR